MKYILLPVFLFPILSVSQPFPGKIGVGLDGIGGKALEFPNVTLTAARWESAVNAGQAATTDSQGWPTEDFRVVFFDHRPFNAWNNSPDDLQKYVVDQSGTYTLSYKGQANLTSWSDAPIQFLNKVYDAPTNTTTVDIVFPPGGGANQGTVGNYGFMMVNFLQTNYASGIAGVKNIRLMRPGYQHNTPQVFRTSYLNATSPFSTLRFMDYVLTNNSDTAWPNKQTWAERQQPAAPRYLKGAPWEVIIAMANYTARDIWINIPVDADSMYIVQLATLMKNTLRPEITIYIEYSNEVWNGSFTQYKYNYDAVLLSPEDADIRNSTTFDDRRRARRAAKQVIKAGKIFETIFGVTLASRTKLRPVFAWQVGGWLPWYEDVLIWMNTAYGPPKNFIYGIASAPYFNDGGSASNATPQQVVSVMSANSDTNVNEIQTLAQYANQWQIKHLQYEGGPDNGGGSTVNIGNRINANRLPEMKTAVIHNYADNWFSQNANGTAPLGTNDLVNYFVMSSGVSRYGCFGATEDIKYIQNLANTPKYDALCVLSGMCGNEPSVSLTAPFNNTQVLVNTPMTIAATASDADGTVKRVEFFAGYELIGVDSVAPYSVSWTPVQTGIIGVLAKSIDNHGKFTFDDANVVEVLSSLAIDENTGGIAVDIFPLPSNEYVHVTLRGIGSDLRGKLELTDITGKLISRHDLKTEMKLNVQGLHIGVYFISIKRENKAEIVEKVIISR